jgi:alpha-glycerophosphate oxidase/glycerol-3-phosphate dehydrogenase
MKLRNTNISKLPNELFDVLIIGGGINGAVSAAALSARGVKVALVDRQDFASGTSSQSSNLAWGGIKYLESFEFLLVNKLCKSRNHLMASYPSTVKEIRFLTTIAKGFRFPVFMVYLSTLLYWFMGRCVTRMPSYHFVKPLEDAEPVINTANAQGGFEYSDCYLYDNDARFVFNFIRTAMNYDCVAANYVDAVSSYRVGEMWETKARDSMSGTEFTIRSQVLINASGPWVDDYNLLSGQPTEHSHLFSKGVHLIVRRLTEANRVLTFFASDGRMFFVIPMGPKSCIGTTDTQVDGPHSVVTAEDRQFILDNINRLLDLEAPLTTADIIAERCGVRPLAQRGGDGVADWVKLSRKHAIDCDQENQHLSIFGGKLTDCLNVGNEVTELVKGLGISMPYKEHAWYGEAPDAVRDEFLHQAKLMELDSLTDPSSSEKLTTRLWRRYGPNALEILESIRENPEGGKLLIENAEYLRAEIELAARREMIVKLEDFLRRRSKISLVLPRAQLVKSPGLVEACRILFGDQADFRLAEYIHESR